MRVLHVVTRSDVYGGAVVHVRDLSLGLQALGHHSEVIIGGNGPMVDHLRCHGIATSTLPDLQRDIDPRADARAQAALIAALRAASPDIVHAHTAKAGLLTRVAAARVGIPCVYTPHAWPFLDGVPGAARIAYLNLERLAARLPGGIVDVCDYERRFALRHHVGRPEHHRVIYNGIPDVPAALRSDPSREAPKLVMVARFEAQKDHATLLHSLAELRSEAWTAELIGDGPTRPAQEKLAAELGLADRIGFPGEVDDVARRLRDAQVLVLTSHWEALPITVLEAMRAGLPVVATAVGGLPEVVIDGTTGALVGRSDVRDTTAALRPLLTRPHHRSALGAAGRRRYERLFTLDKMVQTASGLYGSAVAAATSPSQPEGTVTTNGHRGRR